jgi:cytochrome c-type biogenesis protein CcmE
LVKNWEGGSVNFTLEDAQDENLVINITHKGIFPENFGINSTVTVKGVFHMDPMYIESKSILTGCPSKY